MRPVRFRPLPVLLPLLLALFLVPPAAGQDGAADSPALHPFQQDGTWGYVDARGETAIEPRFEEAAYFSDGVARVRIDDAWRFIEPDGSVVLDPDHLYVGHFSEGLAPARAEEGAPLGYIDRTGAWAIEPRFAEAYGFSEGLAAVYLGDPKRAEPEYGYVDRSGAMVIEPRFWGARRFSGGLAPVAVGGFVDGLWGYVDRTGSTVIEPEFAEALPFNEGLAAVAVGEGFDAEWGYVDETGAVVLEPRWQLARTFSGGLAPVQGPMDDWHYIGPDGERALDGSWAIAEPFRGALARVSDEGSVGHGHTGGEMTFYTSPVFRLIDRDGRQVWPPVPEGAVAEEEPLSSDMLAELLPGDLPGGLVRADVQAGEGRWPGVEAAYQGAAGTVSVSIRRPADIMMGEIRSEMERSVEQSESVRKELMRGHPLYVEMDEGDPVQVMVLAGTLMVHVRGDAGPEAIIAAVEGIDWEAMADLPPVS